MRAVRSHLEMRFTTWLFGLLATGFITPVAVHAQSKDDPELNHSLMYSKRTASYPEEALKAGIEGVVRVEVVLSDSLCRITSKRVVAGLGYGLDEAAIEFIDKKFEDRLYGALGHCVQDTMILPVSFRIP
jgi:Gram-negative bacterial TonB protein C-terminal